MSSKHTNYGNRILCVIALLAAVISVVMIAYAGPRERVFDVLPRVLPQQTPSPLQRVYWIAECSSWPIQDGETAGGYYQVASSIGRKVWILLRKNGRLGTLQGVRLGSREQGWYIYAMRGPYALYEAMQSLPVCRVIMRYRDAWTQLPQAAKIWLANRSVCHGEALYTDPQDGLHYLTKWPCYWTLTRNNTSESFDATAITGISPGVTYGGDELPN